MIIHQWDVWKCRPPGFERDHWFVVISPNELCAEPRELLVNGLACFTLRGSPDKVGVRLNSADGFAAPTVCDCDLIYILQKSALHSSLGMVSWERQQMIKSKIKEIFRL
jgi:hypothetical protein